MLFIGGRSELSHMLRAKDGSRSIWVLPRMGGGGRGWAGIRTPRCSPGGQVHWPSGRRRQEWVLEL